MIRADSLATRYQTQFSNGERVSVSDSSFDKGGSNQGFRPHELLEAALASCMNISLRMYAERHAISLPNVSVLVSLDRGDPELSVFEYRLQFGGEISESSKNQILSALDKCPVRNTLSKPLQFKFCDQ
jgi:putative redox protein